MKIVSACLVGLCTTYQGEANTVDALVDALKRGEVIPVCPEQLGGLPTPRPPAEIEGANGFAVLEGKARVVRQDGTDVTDAFLRGASEVLKIARTINAECAILKERSPACGVQLAYDGTHTDKVIAGCGVTTALLKREGFKVISDEDCVV